MTTPSYSELVTAVRREGEGILTAAGLGLDPDVPTCDEWHLGDLVVHLTGTYSYVAHVVSSRATHAPERPDVPDGDTAKLFEAALDNLVLALNEADADTPVWNWSATQPNTATFWARRMAHESSIHRFDAQSAHGVVQPLDAELAEDGLDELIDVLAPRIFDRDGTVPPDGTVVMISSEGGTWSVELSAEGLTRSEPVKEPDVTATGTTSALLLASCGRVPWTSLEAAGDIDLLTSWTTAMRF